MSGDLTGKFNYSSLIRTLKDNGVQNATLAAKKVGRDNDIENIKELDKNQEITIAQSIFDNAYTVDATNPFEVQNQTSMFPFDSSYSEKLNAGKIMTDGDSVMKLPEIYNDDEYEVADYDDYYAFGQSYENAGLDESSQYLKLISAEDLENFRLLPYTIGDDSEYSFRPLPYIPDGQQDKYKELLTNEQNKNANDYVDDAEFAYSLYSTPIAKKKETEPSDVVTSENEDMIKDDMMDMDMQNDSFNAK